MLLPLSSITLALSLALALPAIAHPATHISSRSASIHRAHARPNPIRLHRRGKQAQEAAQPTAIACAVPGAGAGEQQGQQGQREKVQEGEGEAGAENEVEIPGQFDVAVAVQGVSTLSLHNFPQHSSRTLILRATSNKTSSTPPAPSAPLNTNSKPQQPTPSPLRKTPPRAPHPQASKQSNRIPTSSLWP